MSSDGSPKERLVFTQQNNRVVGYKITEIVLKKLIDDGVRVDELVPFIRLKPFLESSIDAHLPIEVAGYVPVDPGPSIGNAHLVLEKANPDEPKLLNPDALAQLREPLLLSIPVTALTEKSLDRLELSGGIPRGTEAGRRLRRFFRESSDSGVPHDRPSASHSILTNEQVTLLASDPMVRALIEDKSLSVTRKFLGVVLAVVAGAATYVGFEWAKKRDVVLSELRAEKAKIVKDISDQSKHFSETKVTVQRTLASAEQTTKDAEKLRDQWNATQVEVALQKEKAEAAKISAAEALRSASVFKAETGRSLDEFRRTLTKLDQDLTSKAMRLDELQSKAERILRYRSSETIVMRAHQTYSMWMPDPNESSASLLVEFTVGRIGPEFDVRWKIVRPGGADVGAGTFAVARPRQRTMRYESPILLGETGFEVVVEYLDHGLIVHDFVSFRIRSSALYHRQLREK